MASEAVNGDIAAEQIEQAERKTATSQVAAPEDESSREMIDDNGEEVVEAAEDTVIY
jgi:hypothetical protein